MSDNEQITSTETPADGVFVTFATAALMLGVPVTSVRVWAASGAVPTRRVGGVRRYIDVAAARRRWMSGRDDSALSSVRGVLRVRRVAEMASGLLEGHTLRERAAAFMQSPQGPRFAAALRKMREAGAQANPFRDDQAACQSDPTVMARLRARVKNAPFASPQVAVCGPFPPPIGGQTSTAIERLEYAATVSAIFHAHAPLWLVVFWGTGASTVGTVPPELEPFAVEIARIDGVILNTPAPPTAAAFSYASGLSIADVYYGMYARIIPSAPRQVPGRLRKVWCITDTALWRPEAWPILKRRIDETRAAGIVMPMRWRPGRDRVATGGEFPVPPRAATEAAQSGVGG